MQKNDVYICSTDLFPLPQYDNSRLVVIRDFDQNIVKFSVCHDDQPNLCFGVENFANFNFYDVMFFRSAFTVNRSFFEEYFKLVGYVVPYEEGESL